MIETPGGNLSRGMMQLNGNYAQHFNRQIGKDNIAELKKTIFGWNLSKRDEDGKNQR
jgi:hypothetical protein